MTDGTAVAGTTLPRRDAAELPEPLAGKVAAVAERVGYLGEFFTTVGWVPDALTGLLDFTAACKAPLSDRHNEVLALRTCTRLGATYERVQHERLCERLGLSDEWVLAAEGRAEADPAALDDSDQELAVLADRLIETGGQEAAPVLTPVVARLGPEGAVAATLQVARFQLIAMLVHAFDLTLPVGSRLDPEVVS